MQEKVKINGKGIACGAVLRKNKKKQKQKQKKNEQTSDRYFRMN